MEGLRVKSSPLCSPPPPHMPPHTHVYMHTQAAHPTCPPSPPSAFRHPMEPGPGLGAGACLGHPHHPRVESPSALLLPAVTPGGLEGWEAPRGLSWLRWPMLSSGANALGPTSRRMGYPVPSGTAGEASSTMRGPVMESSTKIWEVPCRPEPKPSTTGERLVHPNTGPLGWGACPCSLLGSPNYAQNGPTGPPPSLLAPSDYHYSLFGNPHHLFLQKSRSPHPSSSFWSCSGSN